MRKLFWLVLLMVGLGGAASAQTYQKIQGFCETGGQTVTTDGRQSITKVQRSYPSCQITVYDTGTTNLASIASNSGGTPKSNPFTADADGAWSWYALEGTYDVRMSGGGLTSPITRSGYWIVDPGGGGGEGISGSGTTGRFPIFTSSSAIGNSVFQQVGTSEFAPAATGKRINLGTGSQQVVEIANASVGGTTQNRIAKLTGAPSTALTATTADTTKLIGIVAAGAGTTGSAQIVTNGNISCDFDGAATAGNYVGASTTLAGRCKDLGATLPTSGVQVLGRVLETIGSGSASVYVFTGEQGRAGTAGSGTTNYLSYWVDANTLGATNALFSIASSLFQFGYSVDIAASGLSQLTLETDQVIFNGGVSRANSAIMQTMKATASQTGDYQRFTTSAGSVRYRVDIDGDVLARGVNYTWPATLPVSTGCLQITTAGVMSVVSCVSGTGVRYALNIKQAPYSCVGDGVTDDTTCFQTALDDAEAAGGYTVYAPAATYKVTGLSVVGGVTLEGDGPQKTIIYSTTNAVIVDAVEGTGDYVSTGPIIRNLQIRGLTSAGSSQIGLQLTDNLYYRDAVISDVEVRNAGGAGIYEGLIFSSSFTNVRSTNNTGYNWLIVSPNMPDNRHEKVYSGVVNVAASAGFRIRQGAFFCYNCNGIDGGTANAWAVVGDKIGVDGASSNVAAYALFSQGNAESWLVYGIRGYSNSYWDVDGLKFSADASASGVAIAMQYEVDSGLFPPFFTKGIISDTATFNNSPASFFANSQPIHSNDLPPVMTNGQGPKISGGSPVRTYRNTTSSTNQAIYGADGYSNMATVTATANGSFSNPGVDYIEANCAINCTITLAYAGYYLPGQFVTIKNLSADAVVVTVQAGGGSTVNGSTYTMSLQGQSVTLFPNAAALDFRAVGDKAPANAVTGSGTIDYFPIFATTTSITASGSPLRRSGTDVISTGGILFSPDNTVNIGATSDNRPAIVNVGTSVITPRLIVNATGPSLTSGSATPEAAITAEPGSMYFRTNGTWYQKQSGSGNTGWVLVDVGSSAALTATYVGYGSGSNLLTGTSDFAYNTTTKVLNVGGGAGTPYVHVSGVSDAAGFKMNATSVPSNQGGLLMPFVGGSNSSGPGIWWGSSASYSTMNGIYLDNGFVFQGANGTHDRIKFRVGTATSSNGVTIWNFSPSNSLLTSEFSTSGTNVVHVTEAESLTSTGTAAAGLGISRTVAIENASGSNVASTIVNHTLTTATAAAETAKIEFFTRLAGAAPTRTFSIEGAQVYATVQAKGNQSGSFTVDFMAGNYVTMTATGNFTTVTFSNIKPGARYVLSITQNGSGGNTWTPPTTFKYPGGVSGNILTGTAGATDIFICDAFDSTNLWCNGLFDVKNP